MKRPSFQFYPQDWLSDPNVIAMTAEQRGAYIHLLALIWNTDNCEITGTTGYMAKLAGIEITTFTELSHCFTALESGKDKDTFIWQHKRLIKEREKQDNWRHNSSEFGKRGGGNPAFKKGQPNPYYAHPEAKKIKDKGRDKGRDKGDINPSTSTSTSLSIPSPKGSASIKLNNTRTYKIVKLYYYALTRTDLDKEPPEKITSFVKRNGRAASLLAGYSDDQIKRAINHCAELSEVAKEKGDGWDWTLETVGKKIDRVLSPHQITHE